MSDGTDIVHLMVEAGPDKGRTLSVPATGARIGRSSQNDIELTDPSVSRFQCRVFFKPDEMLWIADLGSTNESLVNAKPVLESKLNIGDTIEIGETVIRVVADNLKGIVPSAPPAAPKAEEPPPVVQHAAYAPPQTFTPLMFGDSERGKEQKPGPAFDLGLDKDSAEAVAAARSTGTQRWLWLLLVMMAGIAVIAVIKSGILRPHADASANGPAVENTFAIYYEKVNGSVSNIFRYELTLENGKRLIV